MELPVYIFTIRKQEKPCLLEFWSPCGECYLYFPPDTEKSTSDCPPCYISWNANCEHLSKNSTGHLAPPPPADHGLPVFQANLCFSQAAVDGPLRFRNSQPHTFYRNADFFILMGHCKYCAYSYLCPCRSSVSWDRFWDYSWLELADLPLQFSPNRVCLQFFSVSVASYNPSSKSETRRLVCLLILVDTLKLHACGGQRTSPSGLRTLFSFRCLAGSTVLF